MNSVRKSRAADGNTCRWKQRNGWPGFELVCSSPGLVSRSRCRQVALLAGLSAVLQDGNTSLFCLVYKMLGGFLNLGVVELEAVRET